MKNQKCNFTFGLVIVSELFLLILSPIDQMITIFRNRGLKKMIFYSLTHALLSNQSNPNISHPVIEKSGKFIFTSCSLLIAIIRFWQIAEELIFSTFSSIHSCKERKISEKDDINFLIHDVDKVYLLDVDNFRSITN